MAEVMTDAGAGGPVFVTQLLAEFGGPMSEAEARACMRRSREPLPSVPSGTKRPHRRIYRDMFAAFLRYRQGVASYDEVEQAARRCAVGARP